MLGAIIGDTVGSAYEFHNTKDYDFTLFLGNSAYTDDSVMTMAVAYWLLNDKEHSYQGLEDAMVMFAEKYPCPMGGYGGGFYTWLFESEGLYNFDDRYGSAPYESKTGRHPYGSWGNGSAMRVSAVGWFFDTLEETERVAAISAAITHNHPEGIKGAQATAAAIWLARNGKDKEEIRDYLEKTYGYDLHKTYAYWHPIYHWESSCQGTVPRPSSHFWIRLTSRMRSGRLFHSAVIQIRLPVSPEESPKHTTRKSPNTWPNGQCVSSLKSLKMYLRRLEKKPYTVRLAG